MDRLSANLSLELYEIRILTGRFQSSRLLSEVRLAKIPIAVLTHTLRATR